MGVRLGDQLYARCLRAWYPKLFETIPNQATGVPILASEWRRQTVRVARYGWRRVRGGLGLPIQSRAYRDERVQILKGGLQSQLERSLLSEDSLCCDALGRENVAVVLERWLESGGVPDQTIGAMYVFERYWRELPSHLRNAQGAALPRAGVSDDRIALAGGDG